MTEEQIHNIYLHMSGKAEGIAEISGSADFPVLFARAVLEFNRKEWQGLTEEDKIEIQLLKWWNFEDTFDLDGYTRAIEAKLKEKNT